MPRNNQKKKKEHQNIFSGFLAEAKIISKYFTKTTHRKCESDKLP